MDIPEINNLLINKFIPYISNIISGYLQTTHDKTDLTSTDLKKDMSFSMFNKTYFYSEPVPVASEEINEKHLVIKVCKPQNMNFSNSTFICDETFYENTFFRCNFTSCIFINPIFENVKFVECDFTNVKFENVNYKNTKFIDTCNFEVISTMEKHTGYVLLPACVGESTCNGISIYKILNNHFGDVMGITCKRFTFSKFLKHMF